MTWEEKTKVVLVAATLALLAYDVLVVLVAGPNASVSRVAYQAGRDHPIVVLLLGIVLGHVFWPNH